MQNDKEIRSQDNDIKESSTNAWSTLTFGNLPWGVAYMQGQKTQKLKGGFVYVKVQ